MNHVTLASSSTQASQYPQPDKLFADVGNSEDLLDSRPKVRNKDLTKTKLCTYFQQGVCGLGSNCQFAHSMSEIREAPNLAKTQLCTKFMNGWCTNQNCSFAHGEAELVKPPNFKKKMCHWHQQGKCRNGANCGFAHSVMELAGVPDSMPPVASKPLSGFTKAGTEDWENASTKAPSSLYQESDATTSGGKHGPDENIFRMLAGRGSAPLQQQVASMSLAIADLQSKLAEFEDKMPQSQVADIKSDISQLTQACGGVESHLRTTQQSLPPARIQPPIDKGPLASTLSYNRTSRGSAPQQPPWEKARPNASGSSLRSLVSSDARTEAERGSSLPPRKARLSTYANAPPGIHNGLRREIKWWQQDRMRLAIGAVILVLMVIVELHFHK